MKTHRLALAILLAFAAVSLRADVLRTRVVLGVGEEAIYSTADSIATVTFPPGTNLPPREVARVASQQYGNTINIRGVKKGEIKLLVETTVERITEIVTVTVVDKNVADAYRRAVGSLANVDGISPATIFASGSGVLITGETYSVNDYKRCTALETPAARGKSAIVCAARLISAAGAVAPGAGYIPAPSAEFREETSQLSGGATPGSEGESSWVAEVRLGDVPFAVIATSHTALVDKCISIATKLRRAINEWKRETAKDRIYPVVVKAKRTSKGYELAMQWRLDQGTKGDTLAAITFDEMQYAASKSGTTPDRLVDWWAATLQDSFRLYFLGIIPLRSLGSAERPTALALMYLAAVRLEPVAMTRDDAALRLAKGYTGMRWSSGSDPFKDFATRVPTEFQTTVSSQPAIR